MHSLYDLISGPAEHAPASTAILAPNREPLRYGQLRQHVAQVVGYLNQVGLGRNDRIGLVLPDGPEMAVAVVCVAAGATCVPLSATRRVIYLSRAGSRR